MDRKTGKKEILYFLALVAFIGITGCASHPVEQSSALSPAETSILPPVSAINAADEPSAEQANPTEQTAASDPFEKEAAAYTDLWERIRAGYGLPPLESRLIARHERWFSSNPQYMQRMVERASLYLYYIVEEVEKRGMPTEIALLPAIESAYKPHAYSRARAVGLWQFIPSTGRHYGLKADWWYDARRDVLASTRAALDYLEKLHNDFDGDWHLALAAYNAGEGRVMRAIESNRRRGLPTDFAHLKRLKSETRNYVPKLMAMANIVADPASYGLELAAIPNELYFATVDVGSQIDLDIVARLTNVPIGDLVDINPGFNRWATSPNGPHHLLIPAERKNALIEGLNNLPENERIQWQRHRVHRGDTLSGLARRYGTSVYAIKKTNHLRGTLLRVGQDLMIPLSTRKLPTRLANLTAPRRASNHPRGSAPVIHRVRRGDTLWAIARRYNVYVRDIARWNLISPGDILRLGQRLKIWTSTSVSLASMPPRS